MAIDFSREPYHDRFDPDKSRNKVLFRPDRPLQQSELNELQSIQEYNLRQLGDSVFSEGSMQTGMEFVINEEEGTITVEDGIVYVEGKVRPFRKQTIPFKGEGKEYIGVKVEQRIIDHNEDPTLLDQTQGVHSYMSAGADRLEEVVVLTYNDESAPTIYEFEDGQLYIEPSRPDLSLINELLATRTYEESGSYRVEGFEMWTEPHEDDDKIMLIIDSGTAYVLGHRVRKPTASRIPIRKSQEFGEVIHETHTYDTQTRKFRLGSNYVKEVKRVLARTESPSSGVQMSKGVQDGRDPIPSQYTSIDRNTVRLWTNSPEREYQYGRDYTIITEDGIQYVNWNTGLNGIEPDSGTTYYMTFEYDRQMQEGIDYQVAMEEFEGNTPGWNTYIDFNGMTGHKPKHEGLCSVDYEFYYARRDLVVLDQFGEFTVIEGQPDRQGYESAPLQEDPLTLQIGVVTVFPNTHIANATLNSITRLRMEDLQKMKYRLEDVEYNQALLMMESEAIIAEDPLALRGVFAEGFINFDRMDKNLSDVAFSFDDATITLKTTARALHHPDLSNSPNAHVWGRLVSAPFREVREISQPLASEPWNVNPYQVYNNQGILKLDPSSDNWVDEERVTVVEEDVRIENIGRWWAWWDPAKQRQVRRENERLLGNVVWDDGLSLHAGRGEKGEVRHGVIESSAINTTEETIDYMRQIDVKFEAKNLTPMANNLRLTFDGVEVPVRPAKGFSSGSTSGTIRANVRGEAKGTFTIPPGIRTGTREVVLQNENNLAATTFTASGIRRRVEETIFRTRVTAIYYDPLAQSFTFPSDRVVTSIGLYFATKSRTDNIIVQIRGMSEGGYPNRTVYAERMLTPDEIKVSDDASVETKVELDDPLMVKAGEDYCITIITDSADYHMWVATLGERRVDRPNETITGQPYVDGVLFSSSNARTWTAHQKSDLKFNVYTAEFEKEGIIEFDPMTDLDADKIMVMANYLTPGNTGCYWEVKVIPEEDVGVVSIDDVPWRPLANYTEVEPGFVIGLAKLRATFQSNRYISPFMALDDILFVDFISATEGDYVTRNIDASAAPFNTVTLAYEKATPPGSSVTPYYSLDGGQTWREFKSDPDIVSRSAEFERVTYTERVSTHATNTQLKIKLTLKGDNRFIRPRVRRLTCVFKDAIDNE